MGKRWGQPRARPVELKAQYGKLRYDEPDICFAWGDGVPSCDASLLQMYFSSGFYTPGNFSHSPSLFEELEKRGYDLKTLKFSIQKKTLNPP